jgi:thioredoxin-like negative regulator of GroEL
MQRRATSDLICDDRQMQVTSLPTVMALSGRKVVDSFVGLLKPAELTKFVEGLLQDFARTHPQLSRNASCRGRLLTSELCVEGS